MGFAVGVAAGHVGFDVVHAVFAEAHVAGADFDDAIGKIEHLEDFFGVGDHVLVPFFGLFEVVGADDDLFGSIYWGRFSRTKRSS